MLTNRELATLVLLGILVAVVFLVPKMRRSIGPALGQVLRAALIPSILTVFGLFLVWCALWVLIGLAFGYWELELLKDTLILVITVGFPILFRSMSAKSGTAIVRQIGRETIAFSAILLFYLNLEPFPFWVELITQPTFTFLVLLAFVAGRDKKDRRVAGCLNVVLTIAGLGVIAWSTVQLILGAGSRDWGATLQELALSVWLPLVMFPFFYGVTFYAAAQKMTRRMRRIYTPPASRRATLAAVLGLRFRLRWASAFVPAYEKPVLRSTTFREAMKHMREFRAAVIRKEAAESNRLTTLEVLEGEPGADVSGAQLDRREFEGTKRALDFLVTAQGLRYERGGNRYWNDLTEVVLQPVERYGLPPEHGIVVEITEDGQAWRAWRQLPNGWFLGIGGKDGNPGHFLYAAGSAPDTWPGGDDWTDATWSPELPPDWERNDRPIV